MRSFEKELLGPVPWLPPRGWCPHNEDHSCGCPSPIPIGGPHLFALPDAPIEVVCAVHVALREGKT